MLRRSNRGSIQLILLGIFLLLIISCFFFVSITRRPYITEKAVFATYLSDDKYLIGARVLLQSIKNTESEHPFVVLVSNEVSLSTKNILLAEGCKIKEVDVVPNPNSNEIRYKWVYSKLRAWELTEYERIVFLDADTIVLKNIDELFSPNIPEFAAVADCWWVIIIFSKILKKNI